MATYYFHTEDGHPHNDEFGLDLETRADAQREAVRMLADLIKDRPDEVLQNGHWKVVVAGDAGQPLFHVELRLVEN